MRRADRLFQIVQILQHRRLTTAAKLSERLEVSERTVYRDIKDLIGSGVPIRGEAGVGYRLGKDFELPPLMFTTAEIQALVLGARMVESWADAELRTAAQSALEKVHAALPERQRPRVHATSMFSMSFHVPAEARARLGPLRAAIDGRTVVELTYVDRNEETTQRRVRPLGLFFWGRHWTLGAWCELRRGFRNFRVDRMCGVRPTTDAFSDASPYSLEDYLASISA
ncbi:MAG: helix-turn-helix transcriptional regulator [Nannocystaceae bacterium]|nr:YafY family transcriptional regulator [bacterium]